MKLLRSAASLIQALLALGVMSLCAWSGASWAITISLGILIAIAMIASLPRVERGWATIGEVALSWTCTTIVAVLLLAGNTLWADDSEIIGFIIASGTAMAMVPATLASKQAARRRSWKIQIVFWCFYGTLLFLCDACLQNSPFRFYIGLLMNCLLIVACKRWFRAPKFLILVQNTAILLLIGLPVADLFVRPPIHMRITDHTEAPYYFCESVAHPGKVYKCWSPLILSEWDRMRKTIAVINRDGKGPGYRFKPNAKFRYYKSDIRINNFGFRGHDITLSKEKTFRIVAIGESTTFGFTLNPEDRPWPDLLEQMIRDRLNLARPVEVINAGFPASTIEDSLWRLDQDILRLKPDMIISYHGINGFHFLDSAIPPLSDPDPPKYEPRPLNLVANLEYRRKVHLFNERRLENLEQHPPTFEDVLSSQYAADIRRLVDVCKTNNIDLVIGTFSLAVNGSSEKEVINFYHGIYQEAPWWIRANAAYTKMLTALAKEEPRIHLVDTHPGLDGDYSDFTDIMHLNQTGRQKIADDFFNGIQGVLTNEIKKRP